MLSDDVERDHCNYFLCCLLQELHAHLNGSISDATIQQLVERHAERGWSKSSPLPDSWQVVIEKGSSRSLDE